MNLHADILKYHGSQTPEHRAVCELLAREIAKALPKAASKVWHAHPVWFLDGNPIVGYSIQKPGLRLMFWSGADFGEDGLDVVGKKFKDASVFYGRVGDVDLPSLQRWLAKSEVIQWDYKNVVKRKGRLEKLAPP
jgi:hypothetical protein